MPSDSLSCTPLPVTPGPLEASSTIPTPPRPSPTQVRRPRRVLYPAFQCRRPPLKEAPDLARRWLLLLSVLVFLQIYTEETHICTELQNQCPDPAMCHPPDGDGGPASAQGCKGEEVRMLQTVVGGASEHQTECVVV